MKILLGFCLMLIFPVATIIANQGGPESAKLTGPYLGQEMPGVTPAVFAPGIVSTEAHEFSCSFTPDGSEFYFTRRDTTTNIPLIMVTKLVDSTWTKPEVVSFIENTQAFEPRVTVDGKRLYFTYGKILPDQQGPPMNIFYVEREGDNWGIPHNIGAPFNPMKAMYVSTTQDGTIYTTDISSGPGSESIAVARPVGGKYEKLEKLGAPINVGARDMYPFVAPDESYLVFTSRRPAEGIESGLFVSFKNEDGTWSDPRGITLPLEAGLPLVTPDGEFLFFTGGERGKSDIYWVDVKIIEELKPKTD
jgi:Tol biopolymer transport system component